MQRRLCNTEQWFQNFTRITLRHCPPWFQNIAMQSDGGLNKAATTALPEAASRLLFSNGRSGGGEAQVAPQACHSTRSHKVEQRSPRKRKGARREPKRVGAELTLQAILYKVDWGATLQATLMERTYCMRFSVGTDGRPRQWEAVLLNHSISEFGEVTWRAVTTRGLSQSRLEAHPDHLASAVSGHAVSKMDPTTGASVL